jgi:uncharacterized protein YegP (UPF0339 family)
MLGYTQTWIETVNGDDFSDPQPIAIELLQMEDGEWRARLESEGYTLLDMQGEMYMSQSASTLAEAAALLDAQCMRDLK